MTNMIDRYLYAVTRRLPEQIREDVARELRSNIEDMLPDDPSEEDVERVLTELGSPSRLAVGYHPNPRHLIAPEHFDSYMTVLKAAAVTLAAVFAGIAVVTFALDYQGGLSAAETLAQLVTGIVSGIYEGLLTAFFWVTLVFFIYERIPGNAGDGRWTPKNLLEIPVGPKAAIKPGDTIAGGVVSVILSVVFLIATLRNPPLLAWYEAGSAAVPLFNRALVLSFLPLFILVIALDVLAAAVKLIKGRWTFLTAGLHILQEVAAAVVSVAFLLRPDVFTPEFMARLADKLGSDPAALAGHVHTGIIVVIAAIVVGTVAEAISVLIRASKNGK